MSNTPLARAHRRLTIVALALVLLAGCAPAGSPPVTNPTTADQTAVRLYNTYGRALEAGASVYTESLLAAGEARARGTITDDQLAVVREAGRKAETALRLAKAGLQLYIAQQAGTAGTNTTSGDGDVSARFAAFSEALTALTRVLVEMGVAQ